MKRQHAHKFTKVDGRKWICALPDCKWFVYQGLEVILFQRMAICWKCGDTFIFSEGNLHQDKPTCTKCGVVIPPTTNQKMM